MSVDTAGDGVFPIPASDFLMVHTAKIIKNSAVPQIPDDHGQFDMTNVDGAQPIVTRAYITSPKPNIVAPTTETIDAVVLVPLGTPVNFRDRMEVDPQPRLLSWLSGMYWISAVLPNLAHIRVLLTRVASPEQDQFPPV